MRQSRLPVDIRRLLKQLVNFRDVCHHQRLLTRRRQADELFRLNEAGHFEYYP